MKSDMREMRAADRNRFAQIVVTLLLLVPFASLQSQERIVWERVAVAPEVALGVGQIVVDSKGGLYALGISGVFFSDDGGRSWQSILSPQNSTIRALAITGDDRLVLGTSVGPFIFTPEGGLIRLGDGIFDGIDVSSVEVIGPDEIFVVGTDQEDAGKVFVSRDNGVEWEEWEPWGDRTNAVGTIRLGEENLVYSRNQVLRTTDGGGYWRKMNFSGGTNVEKIDQIASAPDGSVLYALVDAEFNTPDDGLYRLAVGGGYWEQVYWAHPEKPRAVVARTASEVYLATAAGIFHSIDSGSTWETLLTTADLTSIDRTEGLFLQGDSLYVGTATELVRVDLRSDRIDHINRGFGPGEVTSLSWLADSTLMVTVGNRLYRSSDDGELRWVEVDPRRTAGIDVGLGEYTVTEGFDGGALLYARPGDMDTAHDARLLWSVDGKIWKTIDSGLTDYRFHRPIVLDNRSMMVEGPTFKPPSDLNYGAYEYSWSMDGGRSWRDPGFVVSSNQRGRSPFVANGEIILHLRKGALLYRSTDGGEEYQFIDTFEVEIAEISSLLGMFRDGTAFLRNNDTLLVSRDGGQTWGPSASTVERTSPIYYLYHASLLVQGEKTGELYLSGDNGETWEPLDDDVIPDGLEVTDIFTLPDGRAYLTVQDRENVGHATIYRTFFSLVSGVEGEFERLPARLMLR